MAEPSTRRKVKAWVKNEIAGQTEVRIPDLTARLVDHLMADRDFVAQWLNETLRAVVYEEVRAVCAATRGHVVFGDEVLERDEFKDRVKRQKPRWQAWLERVGDRHMRLWEMGPMELTIAARTRTENGLTEARLGALLGELAKRVSPGKTVGDVFTEEEIDALAASLDVRVTVTRAKVGKTERRKAA